jgi:hypothetical protein
MIRQFVQTAKASDKIELKTINLEGRAIASTFVLFV